MKNDEFNSYRVKNERKSVAREFGHTPKTEYTYEQDNTPKVFDAANKTDTLNDQVNGNAHLGESDRLDSDTVEKLSSSGNASSGASEASNVSSVSTASNVAANATAATTTVATAASVIAVAAVSATAGISVITNQNAFCRMIDFSIFKNSIEYALVIEEAQEDNFIISVDNSTYSKKKELHLGENFGEFTDLNTNTTYSIVVKEDKFGGKVLLDEVFTTKANSEFLGVYFDGTIDYETGDFEVKLDYYDEDDALSDFEFMLEEVSQRDSNRKYANSENVYTFDLEKTNEYQTLNINNNKENKSVDFRDKQFTYSVSYKEQGKVVESERSEPIYIEPKQDPQPIEVYYEISWVDGNGNVTTTTVLEGQVPEYNGEPSKDSDEEYTYSFVGWDNDPVAAYENATYVAQFEAIEKTFTVTWVIDDIETKETYSIGELPEFAGNVVKQEDERYTYEFTGWYPEVTNVTEDATYTAQFEAIEKTFTVKWVDLNGDVLSEQKDLSYGSEIEFVGEVPSIETEDGIYVWNETWDKEITPVTQDTTYTAQYDFVANPITYTITWIVGRETVTTTVEEGQRPSYGQNDPVKADDDRYTYKFIGWDPEVVEATEDATYTAQFEAIEKTFTVTWVDDEGNELYVLTDVGYGEEPSFEGELPNKDNESTVYEFTGWSPEEGPITGDTVYTATFEGFPRTYTITWNNYDGEELYIDYVEFGAIPEYPYGDPTFEDGETEYRFIGWSPEVSEVTGDATYTANYEIVNENKYTITFLDYDDSVFAQYECVEGELPVCEKEPTKPSDEMNDYTFVGWTPEIVEATEDTTYYPEFNATPIEYTIRWLSDDGEVLKEQSYTYGMRPDYGGDNPTKESTDQYDYEFVGWDPEVSDVTGDANYTAIFDSIERTYHVTFLDANEEVLQEGDYTYGTLPEAPDSPEKESDDQYDYEFAGWTPEISEVTGDATYSPTYNETERTYTVTWLGWNNEELEVDEEVPYGTMPSYDGDDPTGPSEMEGYYKFIGWDPELSEVSGDVTYTAQFEFITTYTVDFLDAEGNVIQTGEYEYGDTVTPPEDPTKESDEQYDYAFIGWTPAITEVTGEVTYAPEFSQTLREYTVTWAYEDGTVIDTETYEYGSTPEYSGETPTKEPDDQYSYTFIGWDPEISEVDGDKTYIAMFEATQISNPTATVNISFGETASSNGGDFVIYLTIDGDAEDLSDIVLTMSSSRNPEITETFNLDVTEDGQVRYFERDDSEQFIIDFVNEPVLYQLTYVSNGVTVTGEQGSFQFSTESSPSSSVQFISFSSGYSLGENNDLEVMVTYDGEPDEADTLTLRITSPVDQKVYDIPLEFSNSESQYLFMGSYIEDIDTFIQGSYTVELLYNDEVWSSTEGVTFTKQGMGQMTTYHVTFEDMDGSILYEDDVIEGETPVYPYSDPTQDGGDGWYEFTGWDPEIEPIYEDTTYTAQYVFHSNFVRVTWENWDGEQLAYDDLDPGAYPSYDEDTYGTPTKPDDADGSYIFIGWSPEIDYVYEDITYVAQFELVSNGQSSELSFRASIIDTNFETSPYTFTILIDVENAEADQLSSTFIIINTADGNSYRFEYYGTFGDTAGFEVNLNYELHEQYGEGDILTSLYTGECEIYLEYIDSNYPTGEAQQYLLMSYNFNE